MFDVGWPELLVIAIVLIVVVGPKDLPPMLRAFGRTTTKLRKMANEFRGQFDEALREAEFDDVRKTFSEARSLNPMNKIRDAVNPLKSTGEEIRSGLEKSVKADAPADASASADKAEPTPVSVPEPTLKLDDGPPAMTGTKSASKPAPADAATRSAAAKKTAGKAPANRAAKAPAKSAAKTPAKAATTRAAPAKAATAKTASAPAKAATPGKVVGKTADKPARTAKAQPVKDAPVKDTPVKGTPGKGRA